MGLSPEERETNINWSDADDGVARVYTSQPRMMRKLAKLSKCDPRVRLVERHEDEEGKVTGEDWEVPLESCRRLFPGKKRRTSEPIREAARKRMKRVRAMRRIPVAAAR